MGVLDAVKGKISGLFGANKDDPARDSILFKEDLLTYGKKRFTQSQKDRRPYELRSILTLNFISGNQFCDIEPLTNGIRQFKKRYEYESREVFNKMAPILEARLAQEAKQATLPLARPASGEASDIATARVSTAVAKDIEEFNNMPERKMQILTWMEIAGDCFVKYFWDAEAGDSIGSDEKGEVKNGYVRAVVVPPLEFYPYSTSVKGIDNQRGCVHARAVPAEEVNDKYGVTLTGRKVDGHSLSLTGVGYGGLGFTNTSPTVMRSELDDHVVLCELTELPSKKFPNGAVIIWAENQLLDFKEMTFRLGERNAPTIPYVQYQCIPDPMSFWSQSVMARLIPVQRSYNSVRNKKHEALNRKAIGNMAMEDDGNVTAEELEAQGTPPGKVWLYPRGGQPPRFIHESNSTQDFDSEERILETMFETISGVSPFSSHGEVPAGSSGSAIAQMREADTSRIALTIENTNRAAIRGYKMGLRLCRQYAQGPRILRLVGKDDVVSVGYWLASNLTTDDIIIDKEDAINQSSPERKEQAVKLLQYGLFDEKIDPRLRMQMLSVMEMGDWENMASIEKSNARKQMRENDDIKQGILPVAKKYDSHIIHIEELNRMRLTTEWDEVIQNNPDIEEIATAHEMQHEQFMNAEAAEQAAKAQAMQMMAGAG